MNGKYPDTWPDGAVVRNRARQSMDVILHLGAHRTGSTTFQGYLKRNRTALGNQGMMFWAPPRTRTGLFAGIQPKSVTDVGRKRQARAQGRIRMRLAKAASRGVKTLIVSEENMIGSVRSNLRSRSLYPAIGERMARFAPVFEGYNTRVVLNTRSQDLYWSSCAAYGVSRGHRMLRADDFADISENRRSWRDVITDLSCAIGGTNIMVHPFERFAGRPDAMLRSMAGCDVPKDAASEWANRAPDITALREILDSRKVDAPELDNSIGRWHPFDAHQTAALREDYADDMFWLAAGADGLAELTEDTGPKRAGQIPPTGVINKGHIYDFQERHMAQPG